MDHIHVTQHGKRRQRRVDDEPRPFHYTTIISYHCSLLTNIIASLLKFTLFTHLSITYYLAQCKINDPFIVTEYKRYP